MVTNVPTLPAVGLTLTTCGKITNVFIAEAVPTAMMVVMPNT